MCFNICRVFDLEIVECDTPARRLWRPVYSISWLCVYIYICRVFDLETVECDTPARRLWRPVYSISWLCVYIYICRVFDLEIVECDTPTRHVWRLLYFMVICTIIARKIVYMKIFIIICELLRICFYSFSDYKIANHSFITNLCDLHNNDAISKYEICKYA